MKMRFTIGYKILLGFGVLIILMLLAFSLTLSTIKQSREVNDKIANLYTPSVDALQEMRLMISRSKMLITNWVLVQGPSADKPKLKKLIEKEFPVIKSKITPLEAEWSVSEKSLADSIFTDCDGLWILHRDVMQQLNSFETYDDPSVVFVVQSMILDEDGEIAAQTREISDKLDRLIESQYTAATSARDEMLISFQRLQNVVLLLLIALPVGGLLISLLTASSITKPVHYIRNILLQMSRGVLPADAIHNRNDEIGDMSVALNSLVDSMKSTTEFAREVGGGNFDSYYKPLSDEDSLGYALIKMREDLRENERVLEAKVIERTEEVVRQKEEIEIQNRKLEILYKHITDSIRYAKRLQDAILPPAGQVNRLLPENFILFKPKDIVSGDFYWLYEKKDKIYLAAVDCTGHGVPGAFMSLVGNNMLNQVVESDDLLNAGQVLEALNKLANKTINQNSEDTAVRDGMDMTLCIIDFKNNVVEMAGANNSLYMFRDSEFTEYKADKLPIGYVEEGVGKSFTNKRIEIKSGDTFYMFSDGYADQFGGPKGKKFMVGQFRTFLQSVHLKPMQEQFKILDQTIEHWRGNLEQVDDILVLGFRVP